MLPSPGPWGKGETPKELLLFSLHSNLGQSAVNAHIKPFPPKSGWQTLVPREGDAGLAQSGVLQL